MNDSDFQGIFLLNKRLFFSTKWGAATRQKVVGSPPTYSSLQAVPEMGGTFL